jgi:SNF2 family DNA or RNA helicase
VRRHARHGGTSPSRSKRSPAHRIGQTRRVFATRLIARDAVEERVLELQRAKRDLADAIITADNSVIAKIEREELEFLLW